MIAFIIVIIVNFWVLLHITKIHNFKALVCIALRPMKLDLQFLAQNSGKMMRVGGYYSLFIIAANC